MLSVMGSIDDDDDVEDSDIHAVVYFNVDGDDFTHHVFDPVEKANLEAPTTPSEPRNGALRTRWQGGLLVTPCL